MKTELLYVAVLRDKELSSDEVLTVQTDKNKLEEYIKDYFGISEKKTYSTQAKYLGFTKIEYSEHEDDLEGFYSFKDEDVICKVYLFCKVLNQLP